MGVKLKWSRSESELQLIQIPLRFCEPRAVNQGWTRILTGLQSRLLPHTTPPSLPPFSTRSLPLSAPPPPAPAHTRTVSISAAQRDVLCWAVAVTQSHLQYVSLPQGRCDSEDLSLQKHTSSLTVAAYVITFVFSISTGGADVEMKLR
ncbi:hypothetical protein WMY93_019589 [Mugilogobius chulae]|uniref:Uncharacterized protein n=1 Tax=Mugilogobius chulae TaxID=88201 RepID=A0AAW0NRL0_9GOBI